MDVAERAALIDAETPTASIDEDSVAARVGAPPAVTGAPSMRAVTVSVISSIATAPAMLTATPTAWLPIATLRLAAAALATIVAPSAAVTETAPPTLTVADD